MPAAGGAGGKGVWGAPGVVYGYQEPDARDPNYDEVAQVRPGSVPPRAHPAAPHCGRPTGAPRPPPQGDTVYATVVPELEEDELEQNVQPMVLEYFEHGDTGEVVVRQGRGGPWGRGGPRGRAPAAGKGSIAGGSPQGGAAPLVEAVGGTAVTEGLWGRAAGRGGAGRGADTHWRCGAARRSCCGG